MPLFYQGADALILFVFSLKYDVWQRLFLDILNSCDEAACKTWLSFSESIKINLNLSFVSIGAPHMEKLSGIDPIIILILGFLMVGLGLNLIPLETLAGLGWRRVKLGLGVALSLIGAALLVFNAGIILGPSRSQVGTPTPGPGTPISSAAQEPTSDLRILKKSSTSFDCSKVFIQFVDPNPEYNKLSDGRPGEEGQPLLVMRFLMQAINITDKDQLITVGYTFGDSVVPKGWSVTASAISLKGGSAEIPLPGYRVWLPAKSQFKFYLPIVYHTEDQRTPHFLESLQLLGNGMDVEIGLRTDEGVFCSATQRIHPRDVFK